MTTPLAALPFVHPTLAWAALATGLIPILVHLVNRRRYRRVPWAAMTFLLAANRRSKRRLQLQQWLLMLLRVSVVVLLGMALARPYLPAGALLSSMRSSRSHRIIVLDNSLSMSASASHGPSRFEVAFEAAERLIEMFPETDSVSLVALAHPATAILARGSSDRRIIRDRLAAIVATQRTGDPMGAVQEVLNILKDSQAVPGNRSVHWLSDFSGIDWTDGERADTPDAHSTTQAVTALRRLADAMPHPETALTLVWIDSPVGNNAAVTDLHVRSSLNAVGVPVRLSIEVTNFSAVSAEGLTLQVRRNAQIVRRISVPHIEPGATSIASLSLEFDRPGVYLLEARVMNATGDALEADDARYLSVEVRPSTAVLLVDGRPGHAPLGGATGFIAMALSPHAVGSETTSAIATDRPDLIDTKVILPTELGSTTLAHFDVVVLCNVQDLPARHWESLHRFVQSGGGLLVFGGNLVLADNYNRYGYADGNGVLPARIADTPQTRPIQVAATHIDPDQLNHPIVTDFGGHPNSGLFLARVDRYVPVETDPARAEVALRYANGDPALVTSTLGAGRVAFFTTSANMDWTNLPAKGDYVSLMINTVAYLSTEHGASRNIEVGQTALETLTAVESAGTLRMVTPNGETTQPRIVPVDDALALAVGPFEHAGIATVTMGSESRPFAINVDPIESDLTPVTPERLAVALDRPARMIMASSAAMNVPARAAVSEMSIKVLYVVVALLLIETWMAMWIGYNKT